MNETLGSSYHPTPLKGGLYSAAQKIINNYLNLPFPNLTGVSCPYFLNNGNKMRGGLRVMIGKGSPEDIVEETSTIALRGQLDLSTMTAEQMKKFLVDNHIGVDCSALAYYVLDAECQARGRGKLKNLLKYPQVKNPLRKLIIKLRPVENTGVKILADDANSITVTLENIQPGDMIIMLGSDAEHDYDHVLIVHAVERNSREGIYYRTERDPAVAGQYAPTDGTTVIHYTHSLRWLSDGPYNHGVRQGQIIITHPGAPLTEQRWVEQGKEGRENETLQERTKKAKTLEIRRLKQLDELPAA